MKPLLFVWLRLANFLSGPMADEAEGAAAAAAPVAETTVADTATDELPAEQTPGRDEEDRSSAIGGPVDAAAPPPPTAGQPREETAPNPTDHPPEGGAGDVEKEGKQTSGGDGAGIVPWLDLRALDKDTHLEVGFDARTNNGSFSKEGLCRAAQGRFRVYAVAGKQDKEKPIGELSALSPEFGVGGRLGVDFTRLTCPASQTDVGKSGVEARSNLSLPGEPLNEADSREEIPHLDVHGLYLQFGWAVGRFPYTPVGEEDEDINWKHSGSVGVEYRLLATGKRGRAQDASGSVGVTGPGRPRSLRETSFDPWLHGVTTQVKYGRQHEAADPVAVVAAMDDNGDGLLTGPVRVVEGPGVKPKLTALLHYAVEPPVGRVAYGIAVATSGKGGNGTSIPFASEARLRGELWFYFFATPGEAPSVVRLGVAPFVDGALVGEDNPLIGGAVLSVRAASSRLEY